MNHQKLIDMTSNPSWVKNKHFRHSREKSWQPGWHTQDSAGPGEIEEGEFKEEYRSTMASKTQAMKEIDVQLCFYSTAVPTASRLFRCTVCLIISFSSSTLEGVGRLRRPLGGSSGGTKSGGVSLLRAGEGTGSGTHTHTRKEREESNLT